MKRGDIDEYTRADDRIVATKWKDNKCVTLVQRYKCYMGGVDNVDQMLEYYRTFFKTKKWT